MRKQFVECINEEDAWKECPWACEISETNGGFMCFESYDDYQTWLNQV